MEASVDSSAGAASNSSAKRSISAGSVSLLADGGRLRQRSKPRVASEFCVHCKPYHDYHIVRDTLAHPNQPKICRHEARNHRHSRRLRLRPRHQSVAVPIYQTAAYSFDSAEHGAALFIWRFPAIRYSRISNPTTDVLEQRVTELEGGVGALSVASGQTALFYASMNALEAGRTCLGAAALRHDYTLFAHILPKMGIRVRSPSPIAPPISRRSLTMIRGRYFAKPWVIPRAMFAISKRWRASRIVTACR